MANLLNASEQGKRPQVAKLSEMHTAGSGFFVCEALSGWANECSFVVYEVDTEGNPISGSETDWIGTKNNKTLQNLELTAGIDRDYSVDRTYIIATETAGARNKLIQGLKNSLDDNGNLKPTIVSENNLSNNSVGTNKLKDNSITTEKLASKAVKSDNVDFTTFGFNYSFEEQATPYKWINGKPIYAKTVSFGNLPNNSAKRIAHGIAKLDRIIKVEQSVTNAPWDNHKGALLLSSTRSAPFNFYMTEKEVVVETTDDRSKVTAYFTLYYTKTD